VEERFKPRILKIFNPVAQEHYRDSNCNHPHKKNAIKKRRFLNIQAELPGHKLPWFESNWNWLERKESKQPEHTVTSGGPDRAHQKNDSFDER
jgi:hypothetical protein